MASESLGMGPKNLQVIRMLASVWEPLAWKNIGSPESCNLTKPAYQSLYFPSLHFSLHGNSQLPSFFPADSDPWKVLLLCSLGDKGGRWKDFIG